MLNLNSVYSIDLLPSILSVGRVSSPEERGREGGRAMDGKRIDGKVMQSFQRSFVEVQTILDQNRILIHEINQNQERRAPVDLSRNVGLIRELNDNIWRVVDLYSGLSSSFSSSGDASPELVPSAATPRPTGKRLRLG
ncbi:unnamed protein product [Spirodela intermedia]|uniref:Protein EARLY FLOWERING 4 domain-containing protein n=2 Tax=Spirodela intermedia TaxID=51605 RepID=A0A7I8IP25_SPIIN|nr:unnamed protein product [Spirodela intermedia]CAA6659333.1 unnamed protein product [Spirodela intermedia]